MGREEVRVWAEGLTGSPKFTVLEITGDCGFSTVIGGGVVNDDDRFQVSDEALGVAWAMDESDRLLVHYSAYYLSSGKGDGRDATAEELAYILEHLEEALDLAEFLESGLYKAHNPYYEEEAEQDED